jgi:hypothetical protein
MAAGSAGHRQARQIGAGDEQQHSDRAKEEEQGLAVLAVPPIVQRHQHGRDAPRHLPALVDSAGDRFQLRPGRLERDAVSQPSDDEAVAY